MSTVRAAVTPPTATTSVAPWEVVRISDAIATDVLLRMLEQGIPLGPVWRTRSRAVVEVVVPLGTTATWPLARLSPWVVCTRPPRTVCPPPQRFDRWITRPSDHGRPPATDPDALVEAITAAIARARLATSRASAVPDRLTRPGPPTPRAPGTDMHQYSALDLTSDLQEIPEARAHVRKMLARWYVPAHISADAAAVAHELLANAVEHGDGGMVSLSLVLQPHVLTVIVGNESRPSPAPLIPLEIDTEAERGRGLLVVAALASEWHHAITHARVVVWADFTLDPRKELPR